MAQFRRYLTHLLAGFIGVLCLSFGYAAPADAEGPRFEVIALNDFVGIDQLYYLRSSTDAVALTIPVLRRSDVITPKSISAPLVFGTKQTDAKTGETTYKPVIQVTWPTGAPDRALVFFAPSANGQISAVAVDDSLKVFPARTLRVINFSGENLLGKFGSFQGQLTTGPQVAVSYPEVAAPAGSVGRFRVGIARSDAAGNAKLIFNGWTEAWPNARTLLIIRQDGSRLQVRSVVETLPEEPTK